MLCLCSMNNSFTCLVKSKPVNKEVIVIVMWWLFSAKMTADQKCLVEEFSRTVVLPPMPYGIGYETTPVLPRTIKNRPIWSHWMTLKLKRSKSTYHQSAKCQGSPFLPGWSVCKRNKNAQFKNYFKNGHFRFVSLQFLRGKITDTSVARNTGIRTIDLWYRKQSFYHCARANAV